MYWSIWFQFGFGLTALLYFHDASSFLVVYAVAAYYFSAKMVRLILLTAPIASILSGIATRTFDSMGHIGNLWSKCPIAHGTSLVQLGMRLWSKPKRETNTKLTKDEKSKKKKEEDDNDLLAATATAVEESTQMKSENIVVRVIRFTAFAYIVFMCKDQAQDFYKKCHELSFHLSHPTIIQKGRTQSGETVLVDDYREAYWWLRRQYP
jgi:dolichyl-diphosphooligosaccharide--protein glycosyltransferase